MQIFVSGQINDLKNVRSVQNVLINAGHNITHDWTVNETGAKMLASPEEKLKNLSETSRRAQLDIQGVIDCDLYVICTNNKDVGKGMYVELGAALALYEKTAKPTVCLVGKKQHMSVFYFHPAVHHFDSIEALLKSSLIAGQK